MPEVLGSPPSPRTALFWNGAAWQWALVDAAGNLQVTIVGGRVGMYRDYVHVQDQKPQNVAGGGFTFGAWRTRDINTELDDTGGICTIAANQITLQSGVYRCRITCPAHQVNRHQARLYDITGAAVLLTGTSEVSAAIDTMSTVSIISGRFTLAMASVLEIQHQASATKAGNGFGYNANFTTEVYTDAEFWREW